MKFKFLPQECNFNFSISEACRLRWKVYLCCDSPIRSCLLSHEENVSQIRWMRLDLGMFDSTGNIFPGPERKAGVVQKGAWQRGWLGGLCAASPGRDHTDSVRVSSGLPFPAPLGTGQTIAHCEVRQPWTLPGCFSSPCSCRRRHVMKRRWVKKRCIEE